MKISVWRKYHLIKWILPLLVFVISIFLSEKVNQLVSVVCFILGLLFCAIILHSIKCPKCGKPIDNCTTLFSGPEDGLLSRMSKKCKNCGYDFTSTPQGIVSDDQFNEQEKINLEMIKNEEASRKL